MWDAFQWNSGTDEIPAHVALSIGTRYQPANWRYSGCCAIQPIHRPTPSEKVST
jgi:hypothetical protein